MSLLIIIIIIHYNGTCANLGEETKQFLKLTLNSSLEMELPSPGD